MGAMGFNEMELDAIGEIMNISLGASATAVSTLLGATVNITTPKVSVLKGTEFEFKNLEPAVGVEIAYVEGLEGSNVMMFSRNDVRIIVGMLMGGAIPEEEFVLDEINRSAICEVMNQMMGASATALSEFLGITVNISTPISFAVESEKSFKEKYFPTDEERVVVHFSLEVEGKINSEFLNIMTSGLAKRLLEPFRESISSHAQEAEQSVQTETPAAEIPAAETKTDEIPAAETSGGSLSQEEIEKLMSQGGNQSKAEEPISAEPVLKAAPEPQSAAEPAVSSASQPQPAQEPMPQAAPIPQTVPMQQAAAVPYPQMGWQPQAQDPMMLQLLTQMQQSQMQMMELMRDMQSKEREHESRKEGAPSLIRPMNSASFEEELGEGKIEAANQEMLMKVPLEISVEIGRTKKRVKDILEFTQGSLVVLDKMAGEHADLYVNGQCIAKGDIVVVEDNFGIRITEIISRNINPESL